ncbi:MAG: hypothetical protein EZS28_003025 [Streblomastix strix]|uniref:Uncharacterized protein n=1 Tax=Streblomastix strix TaxID=222440 RepID=A0A5J4X4K5_9EUKA|nr:MAG: hypothetical protein EZS28_003025 [Streblomastix strix]
MSDANGISNDEDYALCRVVKNICFFILRINNNAQSNDMKRSQQINKLKIGIKEKIEEDGIEDEDDALLFHTDTRSSDGVRYFAQILKDSLNT